MSATNRTTNYDLPQFVATDVPTWLTDVNGAMSTIDTSIKGVADSVVTARAETSAVDGRVDATNANLATLAQSVTTAEQNIATLQQGVGTNTSSISALSNRVTTTETVLNNIGDIVDTTETTSNIADRVASAVSSIQLTAGTWLVEAGVYFSQNTAGYRELSITNTNTDIGGINNGRVQVGAYDGFVFLHTDIVVDIDTTTTFYAMVQHHANTTLTVTAKMNAVRLK